MEPFIRPNPCIASKVAISVSMGTAEEAIPELLAQALWGKRPDSRQPEVVLAGSKYRELKDGGGPPHHRDMFGDASAKPPP